ncbi:MAG: hypothetical protein RLO08_04430 [Parvibaculaceae bacterium]
MFDAALEVRGQPEAEAPLSHSLGYGDCVHVSRALAATGWAALVQPDTDTVLGYVRTDALLPLPAPDLTRTGFDALLSRLTPEGEPAQQDEDGIAVIRRPYSHGVTLVERQIPFAGSVMIEQTLFVRGIDAAQGFLLARALVNQDGPASPHMERTPVIQKDETGVRFVNDDSYWQIIVVREVEGGVTIDFPERAD